ncbi:hypothetical protein K466DRAFT_607612 [Polyporus arcularius HHB13444]|uniref:Uncharacterized protein n=1 Tax=Polyporus arcularius HHB13444 TaxID=1314778 RepID=A0A5C3NKX2_9APHY|nr:hypothetical protein K466DRAFT_607612 [Polyporus arcularius HHB13444]
MRPNDITRIAAEEQRAVRAEKKKKADAISALRSRSMPYSLRANRGPPSRVSEQTLPSSLPVRSPARSQHQPQHPLRCTIAQAENEAIGQANDLLHGLQRNSTAGIDRGCAPSSGRDHWDAAMKEYTALTAKQPRATPQTRGTTDASRWPSLSREEQIVELTADTTRLAWKSVECARRAENTSAPPFISRCM